MLILRGCYKGFDVATAAACCSGWSGVLLTLFTALNLAVAQQGVKVIDRGLDQQYPPSELDLLPFNSNDSDTFIPPAAVGATDRTSRAILLADGHRQLEVAPAVLRTVQAMLGSSTELTFLAKIKQNPDNAGTIIALHVDTTRVLELASHGRTGEVFIYLRNGTAPVTIERINYRLADSTWHNLAVTLLVSTGRITLRLDCQVVYEALLTAETLHLLKTRNLSVWMGQRNPNGLRKPELLKGALAEVKVKTGHDGYRSQCPTMVTLVRVKPAAMELAVPSGDVLLSKMQQQIELLTNKIHIINTELEKTFERISYLEQKSYETCRDDNGSLHLDGESWIENCMQCSCQFGQPICEDVTCNANCTSGPVLTNTCCPVCKPQCHFMGSTYGEDEKLFVGIGGECLRCSCVGGDNKCERKVQVTCPDLPCPESEQEEQRGSCCRKCREKDVRCGNETCTHGSTCFQATNISQPECRCMRGFTAIGNKCHDVNECQIPELNSCPATTKCVNTMGGYRCECLAGYNHTRKDSRVCRDINECQAKSHHCHVNAKCTNTEGSYDCQCLPGYDGDGFNCTPRCDPECQNGGQCFAPNTCACKGGYFGPECNVDVDECAFNISRCQPHSVCVNIPGSFFCKCLDGFAPVNASSQQPICQDVDECSSGDHKCPPLSRCQNSINGTYECVCLHGMGSCDLSCHEQKSIYFEKLSVSMHVCETCECRAGVWTCEPPVCDCKKEMDRDVLEKCCPQCNTKTAASCTDPETRQQYPPGFTWFEDCRNCECMYGEIVCKPLSCPPVQCNNSVTLPDHCCPLCPSDKLGTVPAEPEDPCLTSSHRKRAGPIKFGCETLEQPGKATFFKDWSTHIDLCDLCDCKDSTICCLVQNDCPVQNRQVLRPVTSARWRGAGP